MPVVEVQGVRVTNPPRKDEHHTMKGAEYHGKFDIRVKDRPKPLVTDPADAVLRITATCICGSDLHMYEGDVAGIHKGDLLGHEFMGIVEDVGPEVKSVQKGDRVVACFDLGCGKCFFCQRQQFSLCEVTNPPDIDPDSAKAKEMWGDTTAGLFGFGHTTGGWEGGQAHYARVPFADVNLLKVPDHLSDEKVVFLSDIFPTAWWANEMGEVGKGTTVAIWGAGPVGILAAYCAKYRGAEKIVSIDREQYRLDHVKKVVPGVQTINFAEVDTYERLWEMFPRGPDVGIEAVGLHYTKTTLHAVEMKTHMETDSGDMINEMIRCVRKGGIISDVGVYAGYTNHFNIGAFMEKGMTMRAGQTPVQRFWRFLLDKIEKGEMDPTIVITHILPLTKAAEGYKKFDAKLDNCIKVVMKPGMREE